MKTCEGWICSDGWSIEQVRREVANANGTLRKLDMGGLVEEVPDFDWVKNPSSPPLGDVAALARGWSLEKVRADAVLSYATMAYYEVLTAAMER